MKRLWNSFKIAISMYSKLPIFQADWTSENMRYTMCFFPLIGVVIGGLLYVWSLIHPFFCKGELLPAIGYVLIPVLVTGGIHLDGLLDTADALNSYQPMERKLEILKDSHAGAFAIIVGIVYFLAALGIWSELTESEVRVLAFAFLLSRALSGLAVVSFPCAKNSGLVAMFSDAAHKNKVRMTMLVYVVFCAAAVCLIHLPYGLAVLMGAGLSFFHYYRMSKKQFGGITGDLAGYFVQISELVMAAAVLVVSCMMGIVS